MNLDSPIIIGTGTTNKYFAALSITLVVLAYWRSKFSFGSCLFQFISLILQAQMQSQCSYLKPALEEETERLEEQINDLTELHQHEVTNIKQVEQCLSLW